MKTLILRTVLFLGLSLPAFALRDLETGTFITADPAGFVDGPNLYAYVRQNPWTLFDPEGLQSAEQIDELKSLWDQGDLKAYQPKLDAAIQLRIDNRTGNSRNSIIRGLNEPYARRDVQERIDASKGNPGTEGVVATRTGQPVGAAIGIAAAMRKVGQANQTDSPPDSKQTPVSPEDSARARHYTSPEGLAGIKTDGAINPARGGGVHVETGPPFGSVKTAKEETGAAGSGAYVEFDAPGGMRPTNVGPRKTAVIPTDKPLPIQNLNPTYRKAPWWKFWAR